MNQTIATFAEITLPRGEILHEHLKAAYVDFSGLLDDLASTGFIGYVDLSASDCIGILLFQNGYVVDAFYAEPGHSDLGQIAIAELDAVAREKRGTLSVVRTSAELVVCCAALLHGEPVYNNLDAQAIRLDGLLKSLEENRVTGSVVIRKADGSSAFNLLFDGKSLVAFYRGDGELAHDSVRVDQLATERGAIISVMSAPSLIERINLKKISISRSHVRLLGNVVQRCFLALGELAGPNRATDYFLAARDRALNVYPWVADLNIRPDEELNSTHLDFRDVPLRQAIEGILMILNDCRAKR